MTGEEQERGEKASEGEVRGLLMALQEHVKTLTFILNEMIAVTDLTETRGRISWPYLDEALGPHR